MAGRKTGRARLEAATKRIFSVLFDFDGVPTEFVTVRRDDLEAWALVFKMRAGLPVDVVAPTMHPEQR